MRFNDRISRALICIYHAFVRASYPVTDRRSFFGFMRTRVCHRTKRGALTRQHCTHLVRMHRDYHGELSHFRIYVVESTWMLALRVSFCTKEKRKNSSTGTTRLSRIYHDRLCKCSRIISDATRLCRWFISRRVLDSHGDRFAPVW